MATRRASKPASTEERSPSRAASAAALSVDADPKSRLEELYGFTLPAELFDLWALALELRPSRPLAAFAGTLDLTLQGPFEHLAGRRSKRRRAASPLLEHRRPLDPPEFLAVACSSDGALRLGYYFDDPGRRAPLACRQGDAHHHFEVLGESLLLALRAELERRLIDLEGPQGDALRRLSELRTALAEVSPETGDETGAAYLEAHVDRARSPRRPLAPTADGIGLLAPRRLYRPLDLSARALSQETRASDPRHLVDLGQAALDEGLAATALLIGKALWASGPQDPHRRYASDLLDAAYSALKRPVLAAITRAHADERSPQLIIAAEASAAHETPRTTAPDVADGADAEALSAEPRPPQPQRHPTWRISALRRRDPAGIHLEAATTPELEALMTAPWAALTRLTFSVAPGHGYSSLFAPLLRGEVMPQLRHLTLLPGEYPSDLLPALADSALLQDQLDTFDLHPDSLTTEERDAFLERWAGHEELQLFPSAIALRDHVASYNLGVLARDLGDHLRALDLFERSIALGGDHWDYGEKGVALLELGDYDNAIAALQMALRSDANYLIAWLNLAEAYRRCDDTDNALVALENADEVASGKNDQLSVLGLRARVHLSAGDEPAAKALAPELDQRAKDLLRHRPNDADLHYWSAAARLLQGDRDGALRTIAAAIAREPHQLTDALHDELFADLREDLEDLSLPP